ncbi:hypothetical protein J8M20_21575 [Pseudoalteromonas luteoviolacea]|uniref:hypothetical protein n=1 Tax=Pseudoalteromonas luteoviolacea TaxID=43657 RepID=UPI001B371188|nr:hypothetical protein [Pseudoalteromonas luteoviolacea]MBQ4813971.1 hypothetical protein [Pseudoalteromonas luteoviolacea]
MASKISTIAFLCLGATLSFNAAANKHHCEGTVSNVQLSPKGNVAASFSGVGSRPLRMTNSVVCNLQGGPDGHTSEYCQAIYSALLAAMTAEKTVTMWFENNESSCPSGDWGSLVSKGLYYFSINKS